MLGHKECHHDLTNALYIVINACLGKVLCNLRRRPIVLFVWLWTLIKCSLKLRLASRITPRCFWYVLWLTVLLLKVRGGWFNFLVFLLKITSWACLLGSGLKLIFHWYAQLLIFTKSSFNSFLVLLLSRITENNDVSSANNLAFDERPFGRSLI